MNNIKLASEITKLAKELLAFWDMKIVPPSKQDIVKATDVAQDALELVDDRMRRAKVDFRRYLVFQDNEVTNPETARNSNKFLVITVFVDPKTGLFGAGCAGGRMGNKPKLYQLWGVSDDVKYLQHKAGKTRGFEGYIKKKTSSGRDKYIELPERDVM